MKHPLLAAGLSVLALGSSALAQTSIERFERQLEQIQRDTRLRIDENVPTDQRAFFDYGGYVTLNFLAIDDVEQNTHILRQYDLVGYGRLNIDNVHEFFLRARTGYRDFDKGDSFDGEGDVTTWPTIEQAYYRFDLGRYLSGYKGKQTDNNVIFEGGRQFVYWANGLVLAETLDGVLLDVTYGKLDLQLLAGVTSHDVVDIDSSRPQFDDFTERDFYGVMLSAQLGKHKPFIYGLLQHDSNPNTALVTGSTTTHFDYDSWYIGAGSNGSLGDRVVYALEFAYEGGRGLSNSFDPATLTSVKQTKEDVQAAALDFRLDYLLSDPRKTRLTFESILATGDTDRIQASNTFGGNRSGTNDHSFNAFGLLNTGLAFSPSVSNLISLRAGASTFPIPSSNMFRRLQVGTDVFVFAKFREDAAVEETTSSDRFLGWEPDVYVNWQIASDVTFALRYGVFFPGAAIVSDDHPRNFFYAGLTFAF